MYRKILVPIDGSATSARGLEEAVGLARATGAAMVLLHVLDTYPLAVEMATPDTWQKVVDGLRKHGEALLERAQTSVRTHGVACDVQLDELPAGRVADAVLRQARERDCDLIVMGTHGRRGFAHLMMGSDAERVVHEASVPVLLVRHPEAKGR
jgi:nucleotide-binding universal stress UspA family protein